MVQVEYTKKAYQDAKRTAPKDRTEEQKVLCLIDFRQGPNPVLKLSSGSSIVIRPGILLEADADGNLGVVLDKKPEEKSEDEKPKQEEKTDEESAEKNPAGFNVASFFKEKNTQAD